MGVVLIKSWYAIPKKYHPRPVFCLQVCKRTVYIHFDLDLLGQSAAVNVVVGGPIGRGQVTNCAWLTDLMDNVCCTISDCHSCTCVVYATRGHM